MAVISVQSSLRSPPCEPSNDWTHHEVLFLGVAQKVAKDAHRLPGRDCSGKQGWRTGTVRGNRYA